MNRKEFEAVLALEGYELKLRKYRAHWIRDCRGGMKTYWYATVHRKNEPYSYAYCWAAGVKRGVALRMIVRKYSRKPT